MGKTKNKLPVFCLDRYPDSRKNEPFYIIRLEELSKTVDNVDQPHSHSFYMLMIVLNGSGKHHIDLHSYNIESGQIYFLSPGQVHSWELSDDIAGYSLFFESVFFNSQYPERLYNYPFFHSRNHTPLLNLEKEIDLFSLLFQQVYHEFSHHQAHRKEVILSFLFIILEKAKRNYLNHFSERKNQPDHALIQRYEQEVNRHYLRHKEVIYYANLLNVSPNHLNHLCKRVLNKTASQLIYERIGIEAQRLLVHTGVTIKEVATALNFEDPSYFNRFFKKQFGISPSAFKQVL